MILYSELIKHMNNHNSCIYSSSLVPALSSLSAKLTKKSQEQVTIMKSSNSAELWRFPIVIVWSPHVWVWPLKCYASLP